MRKSHDILYFQLLMLQAFPHFSYKKVSALKFFSTTEFNFSQKKNFHQLFTLCSINVFTQKNKKVRLKARFLFKQARKTNKRRHKSVSIIVFHCFAMALKINYCFLSLNWRVSFFQGRKKREIVKPFVWDERR